MPDIQLFQEEDLRTQLEGRRRQMLAEIEKYDANKLLNSNPDDLAEYFTARFMVDAPAIDEGAASVSQQEAKLDYSHRFDYSGFPGDRVIVNGTRVSMHVPVSGELGLLAFRASTRNFSGFRARVTGTEIVLYYESANPEVGEVERYFEHELSNLRQHISWTRSDIDAYNSSLPAQAREAIVSRRERLLRNQNMLSNLGFALKQRPDAPRTYALPDVRRKVVPAPPAASSAPFVPEPALDNTTYEAILTILGNMLRVMEQSPDAFAGMREEDLRTHFLVQLNGQFEGRASGETFHGSGKTDILLTERDHSVFVAECKNWTGPQSLVNAISQLLDYATWRDAKAAILLFNRNASFSGVLEQIPGAIASHSGVAGGVTQVAPTAWRFSLRQREDPAKLIHVTVLAYNIPTIRKTSSRLKRGPGSSEPAA